METVAVAQPMMPEGSWFGMFEGTLTGRLFAEFEHRPDAVTLMLNVNSNDQTAAFSGVVVGSSDTPLVAKLTTVGDGENGVERWVTLSFRKVLPKHLSGRWEASSGNVGVFILRVDEASAQGQATISQQTPDTASENPLQIVQRTEPLPKLRLYRDDLKDLSALMRDLLPSSFDVIVSADISDKEVRRSSEHFWKLADLPSRTDRVVLNLTEPGPGLLRSINITLSPAGSSFTVVGVNDAWVTGVFGELKAALARRYSRWTWMYEKYALNINGFALLSVLALLPSLTLPQRFILLAATVSPILITKRLHDTTTAVRISLRQDRVDQTLVDLSKVLTALVSASVVGFIGWLYTVLNSGLGKTWLQRLIDLA